MKTKFDLGQKVYFFDDEKVVIGDIIGINLTEYDPNDFRITNNLFLYESLKRVIGSPHQEKYAIYIKGSIEFRTAGSLFATKEEIIDSILKDVV